VSLPEAALPGPLGIDFLAEIRSQPDALRALLEHEPLYADAAARAREQGATTIRMVGHGSSDNAASYGVYAFGLLPHWTSLRDSIALTVHYDTHIGMQGSTVLALSQSGRTPDVIQYVSRARSEGAYTLAVTNDTDSELANAADAALPLAAGPERSVAATKTYSNQVAALALFAAHAAGRGAEIADGLRVTADLLEEALPTLETQTRALAAPFAFVGSWILYKVTDAIIPLRVSEQQELIGLDITQHDETVSSRGVAAAFETMQGELFGTRDV